MRIGHDLRRRVSFAVIVMSGVAVFATAAIAGQALRSKGLRDQALRLTAAEVTERSLFAAAVGQETGERGFVITGDPSYLEPYRSGSNTANAAFAELDRQLADDAGARAALVGLRGALDRWERQAAREIAAATTGDLAAARALVAEGSGRRLFDAVRAAFARLERSIDIRRQASLAALNRSIDVLLLTVPLVLVAAIACGWALVRRSRRWAIEREQQEAERAAMFAEIDRANARLRILSSVSAALDRSLEPADGLTEVVDLMSPIADRCAIALVDAGGEVILRAGAEPSAGTGEDAGRRLAVGLTGREASLGSIELAREPARPGFDADDRALVEEIADRIAISIENGRLFEERRRVADTLERSLRPPSLPVIPGLSLDAAFRAGGEAGEVGGDFYDVFELRPGSWLIAIGDVSGKGPQAAAVMALARYTIRTAGLTQVRPTAILGTLNQALLRADFDRYCTAAVGRLDLRADTVVATVATGGHPSPVLFEPGRASPIETTGTLLGIFPDVEFDEVTVPLTAGSGLVFFTDGITERRRAGELFGQDRLVATIAAAGAGTTAVLHAVMDAADAFGDERGRTDDVAVLVMQVSR